MAFIPFDEGALAIIEVGAGTTFWTNTLWFKDLSGPPADFQGLADWLFTWYGNNVMPELCAFWSLQHVTVYDQSSQDAQIYTAAPGAVAGGKAGNASPVSAALVVSFYSTSRGRSGRGRNYVAGFEEDDLAALSVSDSVVVTNVQQAYETLRTTVQQNTGFYWVIASRQTNGSPRPAVQPYDVVSVLVRSAILGHQRRRIPRS